MSKYYVYELIDPRNSTIFYIGKGKGKRMYSHVSRVKNEKIPNKNRHLFHKIKQILNSGYNDIVYKQIFFTNDDKEAYKKEEERIKEIGIKNLCNILESSSYRSELSYKLFGEKMTGHLTTEETKKKISESLMGHPISEETKQKISNTKKGKKTKPCSEGKKEKISKAQRPIEGWKDLVSPSGEKIPITTISNFCKKYNLTTSAISQLLKGRYKIHKGWTVYNNDRNLSKTNKERFELLKFWNKLGFNFEINYKLKTDIGNFYLDGYDKEKNVVFEYDGKYHNSSKNKEANLIKQCKIIEVLKPKKFWRYDSTNKKFTEIIRGENKL